MSTEEEEVFDKPMGSVADKLVPPVKIKDFLAKQNNK